MTPFHVGMKVVCVDDQWRGGGYCMVNGIQCPLVDGEIYTVSGVFLEDGAYKFEGLMICLHLQEVSHPMFGGFSAERFRPAHENRMDELRQLLAPVPSKAKRVEA